MEKNNANENRRLPKRTIRDWESAVEKQLREAMERGEFDDLPGRGKPLDLTPDPNTPDDLQMSFKILKDAGVAPKWVEEEKAIRREKKQLVEILEKDARWQHQKMAKAKLLPPHEMVSELKYLAQAREQSVARFRNSAQTLNQTIDTYNLMAPTSRVHHTRILIEQEIEKFLAECN